MRAIIALKSDGDVRKSYRQFQICDLFNGGRSGRHFASSHRATTPGRSGTISAGQASSWIECFRRSKITAGSLNIPFWLRFKLCPLLCPL